MAGCVLFSVYTKACHAGHNSDHSPATARCVDGLGSTPPVLTAVAGGGCPQGTVTHCWHHDRALRAPPRWQGAACGPLARTVTAEVTPPAWLAGPDARCTLAATAAAVTISILDIIVTAGPGMWLALRGRRRSRGLSFKCHLSPLPGYV